MPASSSTSNTSNFTATLFSNDSELLYRCLNSSVGISFATFAIINLLLLPLCIFILFLGFKQWKQKGSGATMTHSDFITFHMAVIETVCVFGSILCFIGSKTHLLRAISAGMCLFAFNLTSRMFFHILTCMERYLAVVYPITYLSLRTAKGIRIRNIAVCCVWSLSLSWTAAMFPSNRFNYASISYVCFLSFAVVIISLCSLHVLCVLVRQGPGDQSGGSRQLDHSKLRAFYTIMAIFGVLLLMFGGNIVSVFISTSLQKEAIGRCYMWLINIFISSPSSLVLPLLFLQKSGKLLCCKKNKEPSGAQVQT